MDEYLSVQQVIRKLEEEEGFTIRQGTVEAYRSKLVELGVIPNNTPMSNKHYSILVMIVKEKKNNPDETWEKIMYKYIMNELCYEVHYEFKWEPIIIVKHLIWAIKNELYKCNKLTDEKENEIEGHHIVYSCIDNFVALGKKYEALKDSRGTDTNPILCFRIETKDNKCYYLIGKRNSYTKKDDLHIFYNNGTFFDPMLCSYICGGICENNIYDELWKLCCNIEKVH